MVASPLIVCVVLDFGFNMLRNESIAYVPGSDTISDWDLRGFDPNVRRGVLTDRLNLPYTLRILESYGELQSRTRVGECDIGWAPFYHTASRERCSPSALETAPCRSANRSAFAPGNLAASIRDGWERYRCCTDFSVSYQTWDMSALYIETKAADFLAVFFGRLGTAFFANFTAFLVLWVIVAGHIIWFIERRHNSLFPLSYWEGIDEGVWWAMTTVTTVGYGDVVPTTTGGRLLAMVLMILGISLCSVLTGHISSAKWDSVAAQIQAVEDIPSGSRVCAYPVVFNEGWLSRAPSFTAVEAASVGACGEKLRQGEVDIVVMDAPILAYYAHTEPWAKAAQGLTISPPLLSSQIGLAYPELRAGGDGTGPVDEAAYDLRNRINTALLEMMESDGVRHLEQTWFPLVPTSVVSADDDIIWAFVGPALVAFVGYFVGLFVRSSPRLRKPCAGLSTATRSSTEYTARSV